MKNIIFLFLLLGMGFLAAQTIDPFYLRLFEEGETAFIAGDHMRAVKDLEVAVFGLSADKTRAAKACVYLALSHSSLKNTEKSRQFIQRAEGFIGKDEPSTLGLAGEALSAYERLIGNLPAAPADKDEGKAPPTKEAGETAPIQVIQVSKPAAEQDPIRELEKRIGKEPNDGALRLDLAVLYVSQGSHSKAVKLMRGLLKRDPEEVMATYHLSRALYFLKDHRKALEGFHKIMGPASESKVTEETVLCSTVYAVLCLQSLRQKQSLGSYLDYLDKNVPLAELMQIITKEGLGKDWELLRAQNN